MPPPWTSHGGLLALRYARYNMFEEQTCADQDYQKPSDLPEKLHDLTQSGKETASQIKDSLADTGKSLKSTAKTCLLYTSPSPRD